MSLVSFSAALQDKIVKIEWETASETNNDFFTIEKAPNGRDWKVLEIIEGSGNSFTSNSYMTWDYSPYLGETFYRSKQTDYDGKFEYFPVKSVNTSSLGSETLRLFPNPAHSFIEVSGHDMGSQFRVYNTLGIDVSGQIQKIKLDKSAWKLDVSGLPNGVYFIQAGSTTTSFIVQN